MINTQESSGMRDDSSFHVYGKSLSVYFCKEVVERWGGVQFEGLDPPKMPQDKSVRWWDNKETTTGNCLTVCEPKSLQTIKTKPTRERLKEREKQIVEWQTACSFNPLNLYRYETNICLWLPACQKTSKADTAHSARPTSFLTPPNHPQTLPPKLPLLLNSAFQRMCAYSADLNLRLPARHTKQSRPMLPPVPPFGNAQECLHVLLFLRLTQGLRDHAMTSSLN